MDNDFHLFDAETEKNLPALFAHLPEPVKLVVWGDESGVFEKEAFRLCQALADRFETLSFIKRPRRDNYLFYPVIGVMGKTENAESWEDFGVRLIGLPAGNQMTSLVAAIQAVSFRGMTLDAVSRIQLSRLSQAVQLQLITSAENEGGAIVAQPAFNMAAVCPSFRTYLIMADQFPEITTKYSIDIVPHIVINGRVHISGVITEANLLKQVAHAVKTAPLE